MAFLRIYHRAIAFQHKTSQSHTISMQICRRAIPCLHRSITEPHPAYTNSSHSHTLSTQIYHRAIAFLCHTLSAQIHHRATPFLGTLMLVHRQTLPNSLVCGGQPCLYLPKIHRSGTIFEGQNRKKTQLISSVLASWLVEAFECQGE